MRSNWVFAFPMLVISIIACGHVQGGTPEAPPNTPQNGKTYLKDGPSLPFQLGGKPFFPIGVAGAPLDLLLASSGSGLDFDRMFGELSRAGMNVFYPLFLTSETENISNDAVLDFLPDDCLVRRGNPKGGLASLKRSGIAVIFPAFVAVEKTTDILRDRSLDESFARQRLDTVKRCFAGIPIFAYQSYDDAPVYQGEGVPVQKLRQLRKIIGDSRQGTTPYVLLIHPAEESLGYVTNQELKTFLGSKLRANFPAYNAGDLADGMGIYSYPIPFASPDTIAAGIDRLRAVQPAALRPLVVLQGLGMADAGMNPAGRRPTGAETRFMAFQAIVHGAGGLVWYGANFIPSSSELWKAILRTASEVRKISPWLVMPDSADSVTAPGLQTLLKLPPAGGSRRLLVAVNPQATPRNAGFSVPAPNAFGSVREVSENRTLALRNGSFSDSFPPYGVHVYEVEVLKVR